MITDIAIVGSGVSGVSAAQTLRSEGYDGRLTLIGSEPDLPYDRTALSKAVLGGDCPAPPCLVGADWYEEAQVETVFDRTVVQLDLTRMEVRLDDDRYLRADRILLATGARARVPAIAVGAPSGVNTLRTARDVQRLRQQWQSGQRLIVVGGGLIGCEVATTARKLGLEVTIVEAADELLQRVLGRRVGGWCRTRLEELGISVILSTGVADFEGTDMITAVTTSDGRRLEADGALLCVGAEPEVRIAERAGLACHRGISVDDRGATAIEGVFAAGDAASWPLQGGGRRSLETYINSQKEAAAVAGAMLGRDVHAPQLPVSWTEIAGHRVQMIGDIEGSGEYVMRGALGGGPAVLFRLDDGRLTAAVAVDAPRDFAPATRLVEWNAAVQPEILGDPATELRKLVRAAQKGVRAA